MINQQVGRYTITRKIGRGGMATVYQAYDNRFQRDVAIKMLHPTDMDDDTTEKFEQEARIIASLEHHAIVPVYDFGEHEGQPYLVMRLMDGGSLKERLAYGSLPLDEVAEILRRICSALDKAHANHIVHRDIKPGNILFDEEGIAFLADFGIARLTDRTQTTTVVGSPRYMAPEQAQGLPLNAQTDVYQMGVVLFHMLTGRPPFNGETTESILYQHVHADVPLLIDLDSTIPPRCDSVIGYALAKNPAERFTSAGELSRAFDRAIGQVPIATPPARPTPQPQPAFAGSNEATATYTMTQASAAQPSVVTPHVRPPHPTTAAQPKRPPYQQPRRRPWGWILGLGITAFVLLACGITILSIFWPLEEEGDPVAGVAVPTQTGGEAPAVIVTPSDSEEEEPNLVATATLPSEETIEAGEQVVALTPEELSELGGGTGVLIYAAQREGNFDIYKLLPDGSEEQLTDYDDDDFRPVWSPDGNRIAYHSLRDTWEIFVMDEDGQNQINLTRHPADDSFPQWSPDGSQILFHSNRERIDNQVQFDIYVMDSNGTNVRRLTDSVDNETGAAWSPDGTQIVYQRKLQDGNEQLFIMDADGSNQQQITFAFADSVYPVWSPNGERIAFHSNRGNGWGIFTMNVNGSDVRQISREGDNSFYAAWSPNSDYVIYHANIGDGNRDLFMAQADGSGSTRLTETESQERMPSWHP